MFLFELLLRILFLEQLGAIIRFLYLKAKNKNYTCRAHVQSNRKGEFNYVNRIIGIFSLFILIIILMTLSKYGIIR